MADMTKEQALLLKSKKVAELREIAKAFGLKAADTMKKGEILEALIPAEIAQEIDSEPKQTRVVKKKKEEEIPEEETREETELLSKAPDFLLQASSFHQKPQARYARATAPEMAETPEELIPRTYAPTEERPEVEGILEMTDSGYGFLRFDDYRSSDKDVYVSQIQIHRFNLKTGDKVKGIIRKPDEQERFGAMLFVKEINGDEPGVAMRRPNFESLTPIYPTEQLRLDPNNEDKKLHVIDVLTPIGKGQRCILAAPPKAGKTELMKAICHSIETHHPECETIMLLVAERPEEITDLKRYIKGDVVATSFDEAPQMQVKLAEMVLERARRLAEHKKDVVVFLDSLPRLVRAYNYVVAPSGKLLAGGLDPAAFVRPKAFFGSARNLQEGGSVTILALAGTETLSRMDDFILEEFRGTANMELHLERRLTETGIETRIQMEKSMTKNDNLLISSEEIEEAKKWRFDAMK